MALMFRISSGSAAILSAVMDGYAKWTGVRDREHPQTETMWVNFWDPGGCLSERWNKCGGVPAPNSSRSEAPVADFRTKSKT